MSGDTIQDIKQYWDDTICPEEERYTHDEETDDYIENPNCPRINWQRFAIADKGYGYFRSWMDHGIEPATIIATIRELYQQKKNDSRELQFPASNRRTPQQSLIMGAMQEMEDDPISVNWTSLAQLKRFNGAYIVGGARDQCLREVELLMNAFNIKYKRIDSLIYEGQQGVAEGLDEAVGGNYLYHATSPAGLKGILQSGYIGAQQTAQAATNAQTKLPSVAVTRDWNYAAGSSRSSEGVGQGAVIVFDRNSIESKYKTFGTSQSSMIKGLPNTTADSPQMKKLAMQTKFKDANKNGKLDYDELPAGAGGAALKHNYFRPKAGSEAEEAVVVPKGNLPLQGSMIGFWVDPKSELASDPAIMNDPRRLDMVRPNQFVKAKQEQSVAENFADGKNPGRKGLAKRSGVNTKASVSSLRKTAKHSTGEKARMAHWLANMKSGKAKHKGVTEAFDKPYKILRWEKGDFGDVDAITRLDDGTFLSIMFNKGFSKDTKEEAWSVEFYRNNSQAKTGEGDQQRVFATVLSAIQIFIEKYKPNKITFSASKEVEPDDDQRKALTRARLYDSLVQRYARTWGYRAFRADNGNIVIYQLSRINKDVTEAGVGPAFRESVAHLKALGYKHIGSGADARVWAKDTSHVIKILMPDKPGNHAEITFKKFYRFCELHPEISCLPIFNDVNTIDLAGEDYTQIDMEHLQPIAKGSIQEAMVWILSDYAQTGETWQQILPSLTDPETWEFMSNSRASVIARLIDDEMTHRGVTFYKTYATLFRIMKVLYQLYPKEWDLHTENVMQRANGELVIIDPWFSDGLKSL